VALFAEWIKGFDPMKNNENKTLLEIRKEAWEAGFESALKLVESNKPGTCKDCTI
jgi:hypothetical protein